MASRQSEATFWILCALGSGPAHGYLIAQRVSELTGGEQAVGPGTLYATLERLVDDGLIELAREEVVDGRNRRTYRLTSRGTKAAIAETNARSGALRRARAVFGIAR